MLGQWLWAMSTAFEAVKEMDDRALVLFLSPDYPHVPGWLVVYKGLRSAIKFLKWICMDCMDMIIGYVQANYLLNAVKDWQ